MKLIWIEIPMLSKKIHDGQGNRRFRCDSFDIFIRASLGASIQGNAWAFSKQGNRLFITLDEKGQTEGPAYPRPPVLDHLIDRLTANGSVGLADATARYDDNGFLHPQILQHTSRESLTNGFDQGIRVRNGVEDNLFVHQDRRDIRFSIQFPPDLLEPFETLGPRYIHQ